MYRGVTELAVGITETRESGSLAGGYKWLMYSPLQQSPGKVYGLKT